MPTSRTLLRLFVLFVTPFTMAGCKAVTTEQAADKSKSKRPAFTLRDSRAVEINESLDRN